MLEDKSFFRAVWICFSGTIVSLFTKSWIFREIALRINLVDTQKKKRFFPKAIVKETPPPPVIQKLKSIVTSQALGQDFDVFGTCD